MKASSPRPHTAFLIAPGALAVLWIVQIVNNADHYRLSYDFAIRPRIAADLPYVLSAPFLHWSWSHIEGNSIPFLVFGILAAYRGIPKFLGVTAIVIVTSGMAAWLFAPVGSESAGASGVIFGWFAYVIVRGFFNHNRIDIVLGLIVMAYYLPLFTLLEPAPHLGYQAHIGGLVGGLACGWLFRLRPVATVVEGGTPDARPPGPPVRRLRRSVTHVEAELSALKKQITAERTHPHDNA